MRTALGTLSITNILYHFISIYMIGQLVLATDTFLFSTEQNKYEASFVFDSFQL